MKKSLILLALIVTLQSGIQHTYENAEVWKSDTYRESYSQSFWVPEEFSDGKGRFFHHWGIGNVSGWKMETEDEYTIITDKDTNIALGVYPKVSIKSIEA